MTRIKCTTAEAEEKEEKEQAPHCVVYHCSTVAWWIN